MKTKDLLLKDFENHEMNSLIEIRGGTGDQQIDITFTGEVDCDGYTNDACTTGDEGCCDTDQGTIWDPVDPDHDEICG